MGARLPSLPREILRKRLLGVPLFYAITVLCSQTIGRAEQVQPDAAAGFRFVFSGLMQERAKWQSGEAQITGTYSTKDLTTGATQSQPITGYLAFDNGLDQGRIRFDIDRPGPEIVQQTASFKGRRVVGIPTWGRYRSTFADDGSHVAFWESNAGIATVSRATGKGWRDTDLPDPWGLALYSPLDKQRAFSEVVRKYRDLGMRPGATAVRQDDGSWRLEYVDDSDDIWSHRWQWIVDVDRGFTLRVGRRYQCQSCRTPKMERFVETTSRLRGGAESSSACPLRRSIYRCVGKPDRLAAYRRYLGSCAACAVRIVGTDGHEGNHVGLAVAVGEGKQAITR